MSEVPKSVGVGVEGWKRMVNGEDETSLLDLNGEGSNKIYYGKMSVSDVRRGEPIADGKKNVLSTRSTLHPMPLEEEPFLEEYCVQCIYREG